MGTSTQILMMAKHFVFVLCMVLTLALGQEFAPDMVTGSDQTSPPPEDSCMKVDCMDESFCSLACDGINCMGYEWIVNHDQEDVMGETWCPMEGTGMCYCCQCP